MGKFWVLANVLVALFWLARHDWEGFAAQMALAWALAKFYEMDKD